MVTSASASASEARDASCLKQCYLFFLSYHFPSILTMFIDMKKPLSMMVPLFRNTSTTVTTTQWWWMATTAILQHHPYSHQDEQRLKMCHILNLRYVFSVIFFYFTINRVENYCKRSRKLPNSFLCLLLWKWMSDWWCCKRTESPWTLVTRKSLCLFMLSLNINIWLIVSSMQNV